MILWTFIIFLIIAFLMLAFSYAEKNIVFRFLSAVFFILIGAALLTTGLEEKIGTNSTTTIGVTEEINVYDAVPININYLALIIFGLVIFLLGTSIYFRKQAKEQEAS